MEGINVRVCGLNVISCAIDGNRHLDISTSRITVTPVAREQILGVDAQGCRRCVNEYLPYLTSFTDGFRSSSGDGNSRSNVEHIHYPAPQTSSTAQLTINTKHGRSSQIQIARILKQNPVSIQFQQDERSQSLCVEWQRKKTKQRSLHVSNLFPISKKQLGFLSPFTTSAT